MGFASDHTLWDFQAEYWQRHSDFTVCVFDNRGVGQSEAPRHRYTTSMMAQDSLDLLDHLGWTGKGVHVIGYSMGGMVAQELCLIAPPSSIASLALISTTAGRSIPYIKSLLHVSKQDVNMSVSQHFEWACGIVHPEDWLHRSSTKEPYKTNRDRLWEWRLSRLERSPHGLTQYGFRGQRMAVLSHFVSASRLGRIKALQIPLLVVVGMKDRLVKPSNSIYLARILDCDLFIFDNGAHGILQQYSDEVNHLLTMHLSSSLKRDDARLNLVGRFSHGSAYKYDLGVLRSLRAIQREVLRMGGKVVQSILPTVGLIGFTRPQNDDRQSLERAKGLADMSLSESSASSHPTVYNRHEFEYSWYWQTYEVKLVKCSLCLVSFAIACICLRNSIKTLLKRTTGKSSTAYKVLLFTASLLWWTMTLSTCVYSIGKAFFISSDIPGYDLFNIFFLTLLKRLGLTGIVQLLYMTAMLIRFRKLQGILLTFNETVYKIVFGMTIVVFGMDPLVFSVWRFRVCPEIDPLCERKLVETFIYVLFSGSYFCILDLMLGASAFFVILKKLPDTLKDPDHGCPMQYRLYRQNVWFVYIWMGNNLLTFFAFIVVTCRFIAFPTWAILHVFQTFQFLLCERFGSVIASLLDLKIMSNHVSGQSGNVI
ncbi:MAG: hypothetical protein SGCHY_003889 [Lobulomycetales sp.]